MKRVLLLYLFMMFPRDSMLRSQEIATILPRSPSPGGQILISYFPGSTGATLQNFPAINAELLIFRNRNLPLLIELPLKHEGRNWTGAIENVDSQAQMFLLRFVSGPEIDDNQGRLWPVLIHGSDGKPVQGAHLRMASLLLNSGFPDFRITRDQDSANAEAMEELRLYPSSWEARAMLWDIAFRVSPGEATNTRVKRELNEVFNVLGDDEEASTVLVDFFDRTGEHRRADGIRRAMIEAHPRGSMAERSRQEQVFVEQDPLRRARLLEQYLADFPQQGPQLEEYRSKLALLYLQAGTLAQLDTVLNVPGPSASVYYAIALSMMRDHVAKAVGLAGKAVRLLRAGGAKPSYMLTARWEEIQRRRLGVALDLYAEGLRMNGKMDEAEWALVEAYGTTRGEVDQINEHLVATLLRNGKPREALNICAACMQKGAPTDTLLAYAKRAYVQEDGTDRGFEEYVNRSRSVARSATRMKYLHERLEITAGDFLLKGLDGKRIRLSSLKGKVVVVEFWATWCGPCESSFPYLQRIYEKYRNTDGVMVLALNTRERVSGPEREILAKDFVDQRHISVPVLLDEGYADQCGIDGIPTRFVVDRQGKIQFKTVGFGEGEQMVEELTQQIDMLLSEP